MIKTRIQPVIMAGGAGTRLWPLSRVKYPKQFLPFGDGGESLLQTAVRRLEGLAQYAEIKEPILICNEEHRFLAAEQMRILGKGQVRILLEPIGRNTAPAIALAALSSIDGDVAEGQDDLLLVLAADHHIVNLTAFHESVAAAAGLAHAGKLVTYGIVPVAAETGYGYIKVGHGYGDVGGFKVDRFVEKPDAATAQSYVDSGCYLWNSGMFLFKAHRYLEELERFNPEIVSACKGAIAGSKQDLSFVRIDAEAFAACPSISIDYAVMERTSEAAVVPMDCGWSDLGSWSALWDNAKQDEDGNSVRGDVIARDTADSYVWAGSRLVTTIGVRDLVVVETKDAVLVARKDEVQKVKDIVDILKNDGRLEHIDHRETYRPWGIYDCIDSGSRYQVKRITVKPGAKLSVQMHHHRAEHWIVVSGTARITNGEKTYILTENESTYIPVGQVHALENPGKIPLELIEVQSGAYLGEDDIVRFDDRYGRA